GPRAGRPGGAAANRRACVVWHAERAGGGAVPDGRADPLRPADADAQRPAGAAAEPAGGPADGGPAAPVRHAGADRPGWAAGDGAGGHAAADAEPERPAAWRRWRPGAGPAT